MRITSFFRLPIISFIATFCILFLQLIAKLQEIGTQPINYHYSPDFMRILGLSLFALLSTSICLHRIRLYILNIRNVIFIIITVLLALLICYWSEIYLVDLFAHIVNLEQTEGYKIFLFWYPVVSRMIIMLILFFTIALMSYFVKHRLNWTDESADFKLDAKAVKKIQIIYLVVGYLSVNFIFQRYLYIAVYLLSGGGDLPELHNFSFYLSAITTAALLAMLLANNTITSNMINTRAVVKTTALIILSQLVVSIIIALITIYSIQWYFVWSAPTDEVGRFNHYMSLLYMVLNSIFIISVLTCLCTYFCGRFWLKKSHYFAKVE